MGEIGGNDYNYAALAGNITQLQASVPFVIEAISKAISVCCYINQSAFCSEMWSKNNMDAIFYSNIHFGRN